MGFEADAYAWFPDGKIQRISPGDGIYYQACIHPEGTHAVFYGGASGPVRVWCSDLGTLDCEPLTEPGTGAVHPVYSWDGQRIAFASDRGVQQRRTTVEEMTPQGPNVQGMVVNLFVMNADGGQVRQVTRGAEKHSLWEVPLDGGKPRMLRPPGFEEEMAHGTRARNGVITFDVPAP